MKIQRTNQPQFTDYAPLIAAMANLDMALSNF